MLGTPAPFALATPTFPFPALAQLAGRAPLGGAREVALACFVAARLVAGLVPPHALPTEVRAPRAGAARAWLAALSLPAALRVPLARLADASGTEPDAGAGAALAALERLQAAAADHLDGASRAELEQLARALRQLAS